MLKAQAAYDIGVVELLDAIECHRRHFEQTVQGPNQRTSRESMRNDLLEMVKSRMMEELMRQLEKTGHLDRMVTLIAEGKIDPYTACDEIILKQRRPR